MTPHNTFSRSKATPLRERRRRRWADTVSTVLAIGGVALDQAARQADLFPASWRPYVLAAAAAFGITAVLERVERRHDYRRYIRRLNKQHEDTLS